MIGDVVGRSGRRTVQALLPDLRRELSPDLVVANGENAAGGSGITPDTATELFCSGVDVITSGNHVWNQKSIIPHLEDGTPILRPINYPSSVPGRGHIRDGQVVVVNVIGRVFVGTFDCPFRAMDRLLDELGGCQNIVIVDMHAEATSEKAALGWYLDGRVSVVAGTHTHVATADARILPKGTAFVTDVGMVGPLNSIVGVEPDVAVQRFLTQTPRRMVVPRSGPTQFDSVLIDIDDTSGRATKIVRIDRKMD